MRPWHCDSRGRGIAGDLRPAEEAGEWYEVRVVVHRVVDLLSPALEVFPDVYVTARPKEGLLRPCVRTDVHRNCPDGRALFEYRLVLPPVRSPPRRRRTTTTTTKRRRHRLLRRGPRHRAPTLEIVVMEEDRVTRDDVLGSLVLDLSGLPSPDPEGHCCRGTLNNERVDLFAVALLQGGVGQVSGHWPVMKRKRLNRELRMVGKILLTVQVVSLERVGTFPGAPGNRPGPGNANPTLVKPLRKSGNFREKLILEPARNFGEVIKYICSSTWFLATVFGVFFAAFLLTHSDQAVGFVERALLALYGVAIVEHPGKTAFLFVYYYVLAFCWWVFSLPPKGEGRLPSLPPPPPSPTTRKGRETTTVPGTELNDDAVTDYNGS